MSGERDRAVNGACLEALPYGAILEAETTMRPFWHGRVMCHRSGESLPGFVQYGTPDDLTFSRFTLFDESAGP